MIGAKPLCKVLFVCCEICVVGAVERMGHSGEGGFLLPSFSLL